MCDTNVAKLIFLFVLLMKLFGNNKYLCVCVCVLLKLICVCVCCIFEIFNKKSAKKAKQTKTNSNTFAQSTKHKSVCLCVCACDHQTLQTRFLLDSHEKKTNVMYFFPIPNICKFVVLLVMCVNVKCRFSSVLKTKTRLHRRRNVL